MTKKQLHLDAQILDEKISAAFQDVSLPPGLLQRLLDHLAHARGDCPNFRGTMRSMVDENGTVPFNARTTVKDTTTSLSARVERKVSRRWLLPAGGLLSAAAVLFFALWLNLRNVESYSEQTALDEAIRFFDADTADAGFLSAERSPPKAYPFSRAVFLSKAVSWREIRDFLGRAGIAYDLPGRDGGRATLYVIEQNVQRLGNEPRFLPFTTGGYYASAWQENGLLYVLVVQGGLQTYQNHLNFHRGPVA